MLKLLSLRNISSGGSSADDSIDVTTQCNQVGVINTTYVQYVESRADQLAADTDALNERGSAADAAVRGAVAESRQLAARLADLRTRLAAISAGDDSGTAGVQQLQEAVRRIRDDVSSRAWYSVAQQVRSSIVEHQTSIDSMKQRRDDLRAQLARMSTLLAMFT